MNPYAAESFDRGERYETVLVAIHAIEVPTVGYSHQLAAGVIAPAVIRTDEIAFHVTASPRHLRAPVTANIQKRANLSVVIAHHQNWYTAVVIGEVIAGLGYATAQAHHQRITAKKNPHLALQAITIGVAGNGISGDVLGKAGGAGVNMLEQLLSECDLQ